MTARRKPLAQRYPDDTRGIDRFSPPDLRLWAHVRTGDERHDRITKRLLRALMEGKVMEEQVDAQDAFGLLRSYSRHRDFVRLALCRVENALHERGIVHDASKMLSDEFAGFSRINAAARINKFGSPEYADGMRRERATIDLHFKRNSHHPECESLNAHPIEPVSARPKSFLDVIEMVCDWWGARLGYDDPKPWRESAAMNLAAKGKYLTPEQRWLAEQVVAFFELGGR